MSRAPYPNSWIGSRISERYSIENFVQVCRAGRLRGDTEDDIGVTQVSLDIRWKIIRLGDCTPCKVRRRGERELGAILCCFHL